jgi:geranylgeranyl pyrophosphate synthase
MRRGKPSVWSRFGKDIAISTGDLLISAAYYGHRGILSAAQRACDAVSPHY